MTALALRQPGRTCYARSAPALNLRAMNDAEHARGEPPDASDERLMLAWAAGDASAFE